MRMLLTGLRGVGKTTIGRFLAKELGNKFYSFGDLMERYCNRIYPGVSRDAVRSVLTLEEQLKACREIAEEMMGESSFIFEALTVVADACGLMIPVQPVIRKMHLDGIIQLTASSRTIIERRNKDNEKIRPIRFLTESDEELDHQQIVCESYVTALAVKLSIPAFIISNENLENALLMCRNAMRIIRIERDYQGRI